MSEKSAANSNAQLKTLLSRTDWAEILKLLEKKSYQRKFQIVEAYTDLVAQKGLSEVTHSDIAKKCGITRQLVDHHFPDKTALVTLTYRYIYAGFQKLAADAISAREGFLAQLRGYVDAHSVWIKEKRSHARFLIQFYALLQVNAEFASVQERNIKIGQERIASLCILARREGLFQNVTDKVLKIRASSFQTYGLGFIAMNVWKDPARDLAIETQEFWRITLSILGIQA